MSPALAAASVIRKTDAYGLRIVPAVKPLVGLKVDHRNDRFYIGSVWGYPGKANGSVLTVGPVLGEPDSNGVVETALYRYKLL
jgi:hypothetical protein